MKKNKIIAITGGIGSGKSVVLNFLKGQGFYTLSCDQICNDIYSKRRVLKKLQSLFPQAVSGKYKLTLDRAKLAQIIFSNDQSYTLLYSYTTQLILKKTLSLVKRVKKDAIVEVPLLFECNATHFFDAVLVIKRDKNARLQAVIERSNLTKEQVELRMAKQIDYDSFDFTPYRVIENDATSQELCEKALFCINEILNDTNC